MKKPKAKKSRNRPKKGKSVGRTPTSCQTSLPPKKPRTNAEIRQWYKKEVSTIPKRNEKWKREGVPLKERAKRAHKIRHDARVRARKMMADPAEVEALRARDRKKYGNPDGPTLESLHEKNLGKGMTEQESYESIIGSSQRTDAATDKRHGVKK